MSYFTHYALRITFYVLHHHLPLFLTLILFSLLTLYQSVALPLGEADDETDHYQYLRFVARTGHPPLTEAERREAGFKGGLAPLYYWLTAWPIALVGEEAKPDIRRVDARPERHIPDDGLGINHVMHTLDEAWPWQGQVLAWHLVRLLSLPLGWVTIIATYALVRRLIPESKTVALIAALFLATLPRFVISSAVINDDNLVFALITLLLLVQVAIIQPPQPPSPKQMALFGALFGLCLMTKYFSLILLPEILFTLWIASHKTANHNQTNRQLPIITRYISRLIPYSLLPTSYFLLPFVLTAGLWFIFVIVRFNRIDELGWIPGLAASLGEPQITEGLIGLLSGQSVRPVAATYPLPEWFSLLYRSFWFEYGWMRLFAPAWIYTLFTIFLLFALIGLIGKVTINKSGRLRLAQTGLPSVANPTEGGGFGNPPRAFTPALISLLSLHLGLFLVVVLARYILSATIDTGQGRHLYPALPVIALLIALGLDDLRFTKKVFYRLLLPVYYLFLATCYFLPSLATLWPTFFILPHYQTLPVTTRQAMATYQHQLEFAAGLSLIGLDANPIASAGDALPVTLYWRAAKEAQQDYLISLCLQDENQRPVGCWRGHFADGAYPARAWEENDILIDTIFIPIPVCYRILEASYTLYLEIWPLDPTQPETSVAASPVLQHTFGESKIMIKATESLLTSLPQTAELWLADRRLTAPTLARLRQTLTQITYATHSLEPAPKFVLAARPEVEWRPLPWFRTPLYLPCDDGPSPFAILDHFVVEPTLASGLYQPQPPAFLPQVTLSLRDRLFAPVTSTLTFSQTLSPLTLQLFDQPPSSLSSTPYSLPPTPTLPLTIRWQARRWLAEPLVVAIKLLDKDFAIGGERIVTLGNRYPNLLWLPTEIIEETYPIRLKPEAPPGLYRLEIGLLRQDKDLPNGYEALSLTEAETVLGDNLYPLTIRLLDPAHNTPPAQPFQAQLGAQIQLVGYEINPLFSDSPPALSLVLYWESTAKIPADYTVFTQLVGPDGQVWAQDNPPQAGRYPTSAWIERDRVVDRYRLTLSETAPAGDYRLLVGMYDPATGARLPATIKGQPQPDNALELTTLPFKP